GVLSVGRAHGVLGYGTVGARRCHDRIEEGFCMIEPRQVWAVFKDGTLVSLRFALAARASEVDEAQVPSYARASWRRAALDPHEETDPSYVAIPTQWRRAPMSCAAG